MKDLELQEQFFFQFFFNKFFNLVFVNFECILKPIVKLLLWYRLVLEFMYNKYTKTQFLVISNFDRELMERTMVKTRDVNPRKTKSSGAAQRQFPVFWL